MLSNIIELVREINTALAQNIPRHGTKGFKAANKQLVM
jgi:hypothetical protein